jgi:hypothetical protein
VSFYFGCTLGDWALIWLHCYLDYLFTTHQHSVSIHTHHPIPLIANTCTHVLPPSDLIDTAIHSASVHVRVTIALHIAYCTRLVYVYSPPLPTPPPRLFSTPLYPHPPPLLRLIKITNPIVSPLSAPLLLIHQHNPHAPYLFSQLLNFSSRKKKPPSIRMGYVVGMVLLFGVFCWLVYFLWVLGSFYCGAWPMIDWSGLILYRCCCLRI